MGASIEPYPIGLPRILNPRFLSLACVTIVGWFLFAVLDPELAAGQQLPNWAPLPWTFSQITTNSSPESGLCRN
jgi:hypothetical protein